MNKAILLRILSSSLVFIAILSVQPYTTLRIGNVTIWWLIELILLYVFWWSKRCFFDRGNTKAMMIVMVYLWWNVFSCFRGIFIAETYWDFKGLVANTLALLLPLVAFIATDKNQMQFILRSYVIYGLPLFVLLIPFVPTGAYGFYLVPISLIFLFLPVLSKQWKVIVSAIVLLVLLVDLGARSNVIKFGLPLLLLFIYYFRILISKWMMESARLILLFAPMILFVLATTGIFNVFKMDQYINGDYKQVKKNIYGEIKEENLISDTRTFLYVEVLNTVVKYDSWWFGRTPARGNESSSFGNDDMNGRNERLRNEVGILNVFTWTGIVGVILYFLVFWKASFLAINRSNNIFSKMLGLFVAFRWSYAWVEDINSFSLNYVILWMMIGMCFSKSFREMSNFEVKLWVRGIFDKPYVLAGLKLDQMKRLSKTKNK